MYKSSGKFPVQSSSQMPQICMYFPLNMKCILVIARAKICLLLYPYPSVWFIAVGCGRQASQHWASRSGLRPLTSQRFSSTQRLTGQLRHPAHPKSEFVPSLYLGKAFPNQVTSSFQVSEVP